MDKLFFIYFLKSSFFIDALTIGVLLIPRLFFFPQKHKLAKTVCSIIVQYKSEIYCTVRNKVLVYNRSCLLLFSISVCCQ